MKNKYRDQTDLHKGTVPLSGTPGCKRSKLELQRDRGDVREAATKRSSSVSRRGMPTQGFKKFCCLLCDKVLIFYLITRPQ